MLRISSPPGPSDPSWYTALAAHETHVFTSSDWLNQLGPYAGTGGDERTANAIFSYSGGFLVTSGIYNGSTHIPGPFICLHGGGHAAYNGNEIAAFGPLTSESPTWYWAAGADPATTGSPTNGNMPASCHTYSYLEYLSSVNKLIVPVMAAYYDGAGASFAARLFNFGYVNPSAALQSAWESIPNCPGGSQAIFGGHSTYDSADDVLWYFDGYGQNYAASYDVQGNSWTRYPSGSGYLDPPIDYTDRRTCAIDPVTKVVVIQQASAPPVCFDARNPGDGYYTPGGTNRPADGNGSVLFDPVNRRWVYYAGGDTIRYCDVPANPYAGGDNFNWTSVTIGSGLPTVGGTSGDGQSMYNRWRYCPSPAGYVGIAGNNRNVIFVRA